MNIFLISAFALSRRGYDGRDTCGMEVQRLGTPIIFCYVGASTQAGVLIPNCAVPCHILIGSTFQITSLYFMSCKV